MICGFNLCPVPCPPAARCKRFEKRLDGAHATGPFVEREGIDAVSWAATFHANETAERQTRERRVASVLLVTE